MAKVLLNISCPLARADATPASFADIAGITVETKLKSAPATAWSRLGPDVVPSQNAVQMSVNNVAPGAWLYAATFHDKSPGGPDLRVECELGVATSPLVGGGIAASIAP